MSLTTIIDEQRALAARLHYRAKLEQIGPMFDIYTRDARVCERTVAVLVDLMTPDEPIHVECLPGSEPCVVDQPAYERDPHPGMGTLAEIEAWEARNPKVSQPGEDPIEIDDKQLPSTTRNQ